MLSNVRRFLQFESASGIILFLVAILALICANSPFAVFHKEFHSRFLFMINEGLMSLFFLMVTLELKRSYLKGVLSSSSVRLPAFAALGGMVVPALVYLLVNFNAPDILRGWPTPIATDIAFALGVLSLFGRRVPISLKLFLLVLAIFDDIGAIIVIALLYTEQLSLLFLALSILSIGLLYGLYRRSVVLPLYLLIGVALWVSLFKSGIHPTLSGVLLGLFIPASEDERLSLVHKVERFLQPLVSLFIVPLFVFTNAGFSFQKVALGNLTDTLVLGIVSGLFIGKQIGVFGFSWVLIKWKKAKLPDKSTWLQLYGVAILCGIGFTMSLFLGTLSFQNENIYLAEVRLGVIIGSTLSGLAGAFILTMTLPKAFRSIR